MRCSSCCSSRPPPPKFSRTKRTTPAGFRNVLPPGSKGTDNAAELAAFQAASYPEHWIDQQGKGVGDPQPSCWDKDRSVIASGVSVPPAPFQNRPTFQQTVALERGVPKL